MNNQQLCAYRKGEHSVQTVFDSDGNCIYSGKHVDRYYYEGFLIITLGDAVKRIAIAMAETFCTPWKEISEGDYWTALEDLPPEEHRDGCFRSMEYWSGDYTAHYIDNGGTYYTATRKAVSGWALYRQELATQLLEEEVAA
jgi:hypothetical protein